MPSRNPTFYYRNKHLFEEERASYYQHKAKEVIPGVCRLFRLLPAARPFLLSAVCSAGRVLPGVCARRFLYCDSSAGHFSSICVL